jgi:integrase/recombinase XerD
MTKRNQEEPTLDGAQRQSTEIKHLTAEQLENFLDVVFRHGSARDHALFCSIYHWAMRESEATDLKTTDLNWQTRQGHIVGKKDGTTADLFMITVKGKPFMDQEKAMRRYNAERKATNEMSTFFFASQKGGNLNPLSVNRLYHKYFDLMNAERLEKGLPAVDPQVSNVHSLRHTWCTLAADTGMSIYAIAQVARHRSLNSTMKYAHGSTALASQAWQRKVYEAHQ